MIIKILYSGYFWYLVRWAFYIYLLFCTIGNILTFGFGNFGKYHLPFLFWMAQFQPGNNGPYTNNSRICELYCEIPRFPCSAESYLMQCGLSEEEVKELSDMG